MHSDRSAPQVPRWCPETERVWKPIRNGQSQMALDRKVTDDPDDLGVRRCLVANVVWLATIKDEAVALAEYCLLAIDTHDDFALKHITALLSHGREHASAR